MGRPIKLSVLTKRIKESKEKTSVARESKRKRQAARKAVAVQETLPNFDREHSDCGQTPKEVLNCYHVQQWFRDAITTRISWSVTLPPNSKWWGGKQLSLAKTLLEAYGGELVKKAIFYLCDNWEEMIKVDTGLSGIPTVEFLWGGRDRIFPMAERGAPFVGAKKRTMRTCRDADEYVEPEDDAVGHGW